MNYMDIPSFLTALPIAHRGLHDHDLPENSLAAFRAAIRAGYAIETDVRFSKDKKLVVFHDDSVDRMTDASGSVSAFTADDLTTLRLGGTSERIPLFSEFLEEVAGKTPVLLEIKDMENVGGAEIARAVAEEIANCPRLVYAVQSFQPAYVKAYKKLCPQTACGILATGQKFTKADFGGSPLWRIKAHVLNNMSLNFSVKPDFVSYRTEDLPNRRVSAFKGAKLAWTVRSPEEAERVKAYADNIIFEGFCPAIV